MLSLLAEPTPLVSLLSVLILKTGMADTSCNIEFVVSLLDVVLADTAPSFKASDGYLPMLDGLKVDENLN